MLRLQPPCRTCKHKDESPISEPNCEGCVDYSNHEKDDNMDNNEKYIILRMSDVKLILNSLNKDDQSLEHITKRFENETGADIEEIVELLKMLPLCGACVIEGQKHNCQSILAWKYGRRLKRLVDRAHGIIHEEII